MPLILQDLLQYRVPGDLLVSALILAGPTLCYSLVWEASTVSATPTTTDT